MAMKFEIEDNLTEYFNELEKHFNSHKDTLGVAFARKVVGNYGEERSHIAKHMSKWNPYLYTTGQNQNYWDWNVGEDKTTVEVLYSGKHIHQDRRSGITRIWWEFATKETRGNYSWERKLDRDYAEFQETGDSSNAHFPIDPEKARNKHGINKGLREVNQKDLDKAGEYLMIIMELRMLMNP